VAGTALRRGAWRGAGEACAWPGAGQEEEEEAGAEGEAVSALGAVRLSVGEAPSALRRKPVTRSLSRGRHLFCPAGSPGFGAAQGQRWLNRRRGASSSAPATETQGEGAQQPGTWGIGLVGTWISVGLFLLALAFWAESGNITHNLISG
jgi:hypothetical protein